MATFRVTTEAMQVGRALPPWQRSDRYNIYNSGVPFQEAYILYKHAYQAYVTCLTLMQNEKYVFEGISKCMTVIEKGA